MGIAIIVMILMIVVLYLIVLASDETRKLKQEEKKTNVGVISLAKMNVKLLGNNYRLKKENRRIEESNEELRDEYNNHLILKYEYEKVLRSTIIDLLDIQDINNLGILEEEKNKNRNVIINKIIKDFSNKINELDASRKTSSSNKKHL